MGQREVEGVKKQGVEIKLEMYKTFIAPLKSR